MKNALIALILLFPLATIHGMENKPKKNHKKKEAAANGITKVKDLKEVKTNGSIKAAELLLDDSQTAENSNPSPSQTTEKPKPPLLKLMEQLKTITTASVPMQQETFVQLAANCKEAKYPDDKKKQAIESLDASISYYNPGESTNLVKNIYNSSKRITLLSDETKITMEEISKRLQQLSAEDSVLEAQIKELEKQRQAKMNVQLDLEKEKDFYQTIAGIYPLLKMINRFHLEATKKTAEAQRIKIAQEISTIEKEQSQYTADKITSKDTPEYKIKIESFGKTLQTKKQEQTTNEQEISDLEELLSKIDKPGTKVGNLYRYLGF